MGEESKEVVRFEASKPPGSSRALADLIARPDIQASIAQVIPKHLTPERIVKMMLMAVSRQPKLLQCTQSSLLKCAMIGAETGLDFSGTLGRAYLVPFGNEATFMPGYLGLADLARNSGEIVSIDAQVVYSQDKFTLIRGLEPVFKHEEDLFGDKLDQDIVGAYMVAIFKSGGHHVEWMTIKQIEAIRKRSKAANSGPWVTDYAAMCRKTVMRRGLKFCPISTDTQMKIAKAEEDEFIQTVGHTVQRSTLEFSDLDAKPSLSPDDLKPTPVTEPEPSTGKIGACEKYWIETMDSLESKYSLTDNAKKRIAAIAGESSINPAIMPDRSKKALEAWVWGTLVPTLQKEDWLPEGDIER